MNARLTPRTRPVVILAAALMLLAGGAAGAQQAAPSTDEYVLRQGDEVAVTVLPRSEYDCGGTVSPDGMLYLKRIGPVRAAGLTLARLTEQIRTTLGMTLRKPRVTVTLVKLGQQAAAPQVTVVGAVMKPGPLVLHEGLRLRKAIELAGGTSPEADPRRVMVRRKDLSRLTIDLSGEERISDPAHDVLLQDGDSVDVPLRPRIRVTVVGGVSRQGPLEHVPDAGGALRVLKALELAGGAVKEADLSQVVIHHSDLTRVTVDLSRDERVADPAHNQALRDGDSVYVPLLYRSGVVSISGAVTNPGSYELKPGASLDDLILLAGKLSLVADVERVELHRKGAAKQVINLPQRREQGGDARTVLQPGDEVHVPTLGSVVMLIGKVTSPGPRPLKSGHTLHEFFTQGQTETLAALDESVVNLKDVHVIRPGSEPRKVDLKAVLKARNHRDNLALQPGDVILLPARVDRQKRGLIDYLRVLPFFGSLAGLFIP